jgi:hypothetical protein
MRKKGKQMGKEIYKRGERKEKKNMKGTGMEKGDHRY